MRRSRVAICAAVVLVVAGCGSGSEPPAPVTSTTVPAGGSCGVKNAESTAILLGREWQRVTVSRGAGDHEAMMKNLVKAVDDLRQDVNDEATQEAKTACGAAELEQLNFEVTVLNTVVGLIGEAEDERYSHVAEAANAWIEKIGLAEEVKPFMAAQGVAATTTATPVATEATCGLLLLESKVLVLRLWWDRVTASRGAKDHKDMVAGVIGALDNLSESVDAEPTQQAKAACGVAELAVLAEKLAVLKAEVDRTGLGDDGDYTGVAYAANSWIEKVGIGDEVDPFMPPNFDD